MTQQLLNLTNDLESLAEQIHNGLFQSYSDCFGNSGEVYGRELSLNLNVIEQLASIAYQLQEEIRFLGADKRGKHWVDMICTLLDEIVDLVSYDEKIYTLAKFNLCAYQDELMEGPIFDNECLHSHLESAANKALEKRDVLLQEAEEDVYELEEKLKQLLILLKNILLKA